MKCYYCKDPATHLDEQSRPTCSDCYMEIEHGVIRNQNLCIAPPGRPPQKDEESPGWQNMIRVMEDYSCEVEPLM